MRALGFAFRWQFSAACVMAAVFTVWLSGCGGGTAPTATGSGSPATGPAEVPAPGDSASESESVAVQLAKLSPEDRALAEKQKVCPVGGELGSMGVPIKVMVGERPVFICCEGCEKPLLADPDKYLAKLDAAEKGEPATPEGSKNN